MPLVPEDTATESPTHAEWWATDAPGAQETLPGAPPLAPYTDAHADSSLRRSITLVLWFTAVGAPLAGWFGGWRSMLALVLGAAISGSGLWEYRRLIASLSAKMDAAKPVQPEGAPVPSVGFAVAGFLVRLLVVLTVLYVSLNHLHGSVPALAAGLAMGVIALFLEAIRLLRSGTM